MIARSLLIVAQGNDADVPACLGKAQGIELLNGVLLTSDRATDRMIQAFLTVAAKMSFFPAAGDLEPLAVQGNAKSAANVLSALGILQQLPEANLLVSESSWQRILSPEQRQRLAAGTQSMIGSTLVALGRLCSAEHHTLDVVLAQDCAYKLLYGPTASDLSQWNAQNISDALYGCSKMGMKHLRFCHSVVDTASQWLPAADVFLVQSIACSLEGIRFRNLCLMTGLVQRGKELLQVEWNQANAAFHLPLATRLSGAVAALNIQELAGEVQELLRMSESKHLEGPLPAYAAVTLGKVHTWLVKIHSKHSMRGLHDGLTGLLTKQELAACAAATEHIDSSQPKQLVDIKKTSIVTGA